MQHAIIVAGGKGSRFGSDTPKQFLPLAGKPVLMHTIEKFAACHGTHITVVLPAQFIEWWNDLCKEYGFTIRHRVVTGGDSRYASVKNALDTTKANDADLVAIHDGVRPLASQHLIAQAFAEADKYGSAIPVVAVTDSIRRITDCHGHSVALSRDTLRAVQTPQTFRLAEIKQAYSNGYSPSYTDDASVYEANGGTIHLIDGEVSNIKITHPNDLAIAELLMK